MTAGTTRGGADVLGPSDLAPIRGQIYLAFAALFVGLLMGLAQAIDRVGVNLYPRIPFLSQYYQGLTAHGVLNALVFTFAFSNGFMPLVAARSLGRPVNRAANVAACALIFAGTLLAGWEILANQASVLFTMYPPMRASWIYYVGLVLAVVSTWAAGLNVFLMYRAWRRDHPADRIPLQAFAVIATYAMWLIASVGVAVEVLVLLLPWSLGLVAHTDPQLARTLFWFSGHPIVYFWLLPVYVSWYTMIPRQVGGRLFSDPLARLVFLMFLVLSIPTGFHHQYTDPGVGHGIKLVHLVLTFGVFFPSMVTAFSVVAALESGGRARGGRGLLGWIRKLPWGDASVTAQLLAMVAFTLGGVSGLVNASYSINMVVHNTAFVPGHFHLTVGTAVALSFMGIAYWLVPHLTGRALWGRPLALAQGWLWLVGALIFARGQMDGGLEGMPRRLHMALVPYRLEAWDLSNALTAVGGTVMFVSGMLFYVVLVGTLVAGRKGAVVEMPVATAVEGPGTGWPVLDRWPVWVAVTIALVALAYLPYLVG